MSSIRLSSFEQKWMDWSYISSINISDAPSDSVFLQLPYLLV